MRGGKERPQPEYHVMTVGTKCDICQEYVTGFGPCLNYVSEVPLWKFLFTPDVPRLLKVPKDCVTMSEFLLHPWWQGPIWEWGLLCFLVTVGTLGVSVEAWAGWRSRGWTAVVSANQKTGNSSYKGLSWNLHIASCLYNVRLRLMTWHVHCWVSLLLLEGGLWKHNCLNMFH